MARREPNAPERLAQAALDLFAERGYENTSVIDIAQRAGLGKTTFFRHFRDKREVLFGRGTMDELLTGAIAAAPATATPLEAVAHALDAAGREVFTPARREFTAGRQAVIAAHPELQEREALKNLGLIASITAALKTARRSQSDRSRGRRARRARLHDRLRTLERPRQRRRLQRTRPASAQRRASIHSPLLTRRPP
jgi:AcrR family transcriptional regulator